MMKAGTRWFHLLNDHMVLSLSWLLLLLGNPIPDHSEKYIDELKILRDVVARQMKMSEVEIIPASKHKPWIPIVQHHGYEVMGT